MTVCHSAASAVLIISTHTLTWSVTLLSLIKLSDLSNFNSHAHVERDKRLNISEENVDNFNSHAHVERDGIVWSTLLWELTISTHTLTWSVT